MSLKIKFGKRKSVNKINYPLQPSLGAYEQNSRRTQLLYRFTKNSTYEQDASQLFLEEKPTIAVSTEGAPSGINALVLFFFQEQSVTVQSDLLGRQLQERIKRTFHQTVQAQI
jgi:hypothetical protein